MLIAVSKVCKFFTFEVVNGPALTSSVNLYRRDPIPELLRLNSPALQPRRRKGYLSLIYSWVGFAFKEIKFHKPRKVEKPKRTSHIASSHRATSNNKAKRPAKTIAATQRATGV